MDTRKPRIGFIGLGIMGKPMAKNIKKAGYDLTVYNRTRSKTKELADLGAAVADSPAEVARKSDVIITIVSDSPDVEEVVLGPGGVIEGIRAGHVLIDMSTISPQVTKSLADKLREHGAEMLDAPVSGGENGAIEGTLTIMVGGKQAVFEQCLPILRAIGSKVTLMGDHGAGQAAKLGNQVVCTGTLLGICEGLTLAAKFGLDFEKFVAALLGGAARSFLLEVFGPKIVRRDFAPGFMVKLEQKDLRLVLEAAREKGVSLPGLSVAHQLYNAVEAEAGGGELGHHSLIKALEKMAGFQVGSAS